MLHVVPIQDLEKTNEISQMCQKAVDPIFITKNGNSDMVIMSAKMYEERMMLYDVYRKLDEAEQDIQAGKVSDGFESLRKLREKHGL